MAESERTKKIREREVDPNEDIMTRGIRSTIKGLALGTSKIGDVVGAGADKASEYINKGKPSKTTDNVDSDEMRRESRGEYKPMKFQVPPELKAKGGKISSASSRADGCAQRGKTKGRMV